MSCRLEGRLGVQNNVFRTTVANHDDGAIVDPQPGEPTLRHDVVFEVRNGRVQEVGQSPGTTYPPGTLDGLTHRTHAAPPRSVGV